MNKETKEIEELYYEEVTERIGEHIIASTVHKATKEEIDKAKKLHKKGKCPHTIVKDTECYMWDIRTCAICGKGLGTV